MFDETKRFYTMFRLLPFWAVLPVLSRVSSLQVMPHDKKERFAETGTDLSLECNYVLGEDNLHSIKWYRDDNEFYRYQPSEDPPIRIFPLRGLIVDDFSSKTHLLVKNVSLETSGKFRCEVSGGPPRYQTAVIDSVVTVVDLPKSSPIISGVQTSYRLGDEVWATCWTDLSNPRPTIKWWINNNAVGSNDMLKVSRGYKSQIRFKVREKHLEEGGLRIKCTVEVLDLYWVSSQVEAKVAPPTRLSLPAHTQPMFSSGASNPYPLPLGGDHPTLNLYSASSAGAAPLVRGLTSNLWHKISFLAVALFSTVCSRLAVQLF